MKSHAAHENQPLHVNVKSFNILKALIDTDFFSKIDLNPTARLVMFSLANMYNPKKGYVYPKNSKLMRCTGAGERAVSQSISELKEKGLVVIALDQNFRKIYFTRKMYEILKLVDEVEENGDNAASCVNETLQNEPAQKVEFSAGRVAKNVGGVAKNAPTCHEQKKEQINKQFVSFENDFNFAREKGEVKEALLKDSYLTNKQLAEIIVNGYHRYNIKGDNDYKAVLRIKKVWDFKQEDFEILKFIDEKRKSDFNFARKIDKIENDVDFCFVGFEKEILRIRQQSIVH